MVPEITRRTPIGELVMNHPSAVEILFNYGFHCIGCGLSSYETIEEGAAAHGFDDEAIDKLVEELNASAKKAPAADLPQESVAADKKPAAPKKDGKAKEKKPKSKGK
ncbi:MAG: DUF1858 domain-containing protein [Candidatus Micrarchaeia archaeon]